MAEGKTKKEAVRALKRRISEAVYRRLLEARRGDERARESNQGTTPKSA